MMAMAMRVVGNKEGKGSKALAAAKSGMQVDGNGKEKGNGRGNESGRGR
jgi:hypothetical protein